MFPSPKILNTYIQPLDELEILFSEISSNNMKQILGGERIFTVPDNNRYVYSLGISYSNVGQFNGSSYGYQSPIDSVINALIIHAMPSQRIFEQYRDDNTIPCFMQFSSVSSYNNYPAVTRYNVTSIQYMVNYSGVQVPLFVYYDKLTKEVYQYNPHLMDTPQKRYI